MTTTVVVGGSFAGMTAALEIKRKGKNEHKVILIDLQLENKINLI